MQQIDLKISNINNNTYPNIILRKFFNMVFVSSDGKKLSIYTATVFGGVTKDILQEKTTSKALISSYSDNHGCSLKFEYNKDEYIKSVNISDLTESLWEQSGCMEQVWGKCERISTQSDFNKILKEIYPDAKLDANLNMDAKWPVYYIHEDGKPHHDCLVAHARFEQLPDTNMAYALHSQKEMRREGLEFMSWIKTEITLSASILNKPVRFKISLDSNEEHSYDTPDFTWYFAPPSGYCVDEDSATANFGQEEKRNIIQSVTGDTTVHFKEWEDDEKIDDRKKARVYLSQYTANDPRILSKNGGIEVLVMIKNPHQLENRQFFIGLLVAFLLSFCSDKTRLNDYFACLEQMCSCTSGNCTCSRMCNAIGFLFPCLVILAYISMMFNIKRCIPAKSKKRHKVLLAVRIAGFVFTVMVLCYVFGIWLIFPEFMQSLMTCAINQYLIWGMTIAGGLCNMIYVGYCMFIRKKKVYDYI